MPTLLYYPVVSQIQTESPGLTDDQISWISGKILTIHVFTLILTNFSEKIEISDAFLRFLPHFCGREELISKQNWQSPAFQFL